MKKYKHKQTGVIATQYSDRAYTTNRGDGYILKDLIENTSDWQEVTNPEYKILEVSLQRSERPQITDVSEHSSGYIESLLNCHGNKIHSIKRLSDGEIFTVGDSVRLNNSNYCITEINILAGNHAVLIAGCSLALKYAVKAKTVLFKTEDGVDIFTGDSYIIMDKNFNIHETINAGLGSGVPQNLKYFSTKEKAEDFILKNKPCLSLNDLIEADWNINGEDIRQLKELVKQKLNK